MMCKKISALLLALCFLCLTAAGCGQTENTATEPTVSETTAIVTNLSKPDMTKWRYDAENDIYYQLGIGYCETPADERYEQLALFVPGAYMDATANGGSYTCKLNEKAELNGYTASSAPIVMQLRTEGYAAAEALTEEVVSAYRGLLAEIAEYTSQGFVCAFAGCRGTLEGAPLGAADLKAAIRYLRYSSDVIAGDAESIFVYGMSSGGAMAAILGASGDSPLYDPYLKAIGAVEGVSDAVCGSMSWCPITDLDTANAEYEWMMGSSRSPRTQELNAISEKLAYAYADYVNSAGFTDKDGSALTLKESGDGIYQAGSYYDYIKTVIEGSLDHYLSDNKLSGDTAQAYIDGLNADKKWIAYDRSAGAVSITSVADFVKACKPASDLPVAFDGLQGKNTLFGTGDGERSHFDRILADILTEIHSEYAADFNADLNKKDAVGYTVEQRVAMYTPLYYLMKSRDGCGTSVVAKYWRIRSGIEQPTTSLTTEVNLALALERCEGVKSVDFETVWAQGHEPVERVGSPAENLITWIDDCMKG